MVYTKLFSKNNLTEKNIGMKFFLALLIGSFLGVLLARFHCLASCVRLPPLQNLTVSLSGREFLSLIAVDSVFSLLLLFSSLAAHKKVFFLSLFFLKGFCISYFIFLFAYFFQSQGFLIAFSVLLLHGLLMLPLQLTSAYLLLIEQHSSKRKSFVSGLCLSNLAAALVCAVVEHFALPAIFNAHLTF